MLNYIFTCPWSKGHLSPPSRCYLVLHIVPDLFTLLNPSIKCMRSSYPAHGDVCFLNKNVNMLKLLCFHSFGFQ